MNIFASKALERWNTVTGKRSRAHSQYGIVIRVTISTLTNININDISSADKTQAKNTTNIGNRNEPYSGSGSKR